MVAMLMSFNGVKKKKVIGVSLCLQQDKVQDSLDCELRCLNNRKGRAGRKRAQTRSVFTVT